MKNVIAPILVIAILIGCHKDEDPYPVPAGCKPIGVRCKNGTGAGKTDTSVCDAEGGFDHWTCDWGVEQPQPCHNPQGKCGDGTIEGGQNPCYDNGGVKEWICQ